MGADSVITIPETSLKDIIASQLAVKFSDPEIIQAFVESILNTHMDNYGRWTNNSKDPTILRWAIEGVVRRFVEETTKVWIEERHDDLTKMIGDELTNSGLIQRLAQETAAKVKVS